MYNVTGEECHEITDLKKDI